MLDNTWEIISIINNYNGAVKTAKTYTEEKKIQEKYAQALRLQCTSEHSYGHIMTKEDFSAAVACGGFMDYDGQGVFLDWDGNEICAVRCDIRFLNRFDFPFVAWFNK